jgi:nitroreductase
VYFEERPPKQETIMGEIISEITARRARRALSEESIDKTTLDRIFTAATMSASCNNKQPWRLMVCTAEGSIETAREALLGGNYWAKKAPVLVVVMTANELDCQLTDDRNYAWFDTGMAVANLLLQATREGLYAHPMAGFDPFVLREKFSIGDETRIITMIAIGLPGDSSHLNEKHLASETSDRTRKPLDEVLSWEKWSGQ